MHLGMQDKTALVTGAGRGLGFAIARALTDQGVRVAINDRTIEAAAQAAARLGPRAIPVAADLATETGPVACVEAALDVFGGLDFVVNNAAIKAWSARTVSVRLEHYFEGVGQFSVGAFRRQFENFFGATTFNATPEFLALYSIDQATYEAYDVATQHNITSTVRMDGFDFNYKQTLAFLPHWARGVQVFANGSSQRAIGDASSNFAGFIPLAGSWGVSLTRKKFNTRVNWNYRGRQRQAAVAPGASIEPGTFTWGSKRLYVDVLGEYYLKRQVALFFNLRNVGDATEDTEVSGPSTPAHAQFRTRLDYASLWTFGIKGTF